MKEFLKTNTITYNLMSFTAFKSILVFSLLSEGPKSYKEIQEYFKNHEYLKETISVDSIRIYLNSLKEVGCEINKKTKNGVTKYSIDSHPFQFTFTQEQITSIIKVYRAISQNIDVTDLISLQHFFKKISVHINDEKLISTLENISPLKNINPKMVSELIKHTENNNEITIKYNSQTSGKKLITILTDKMKVTNGKLYISGINSEYENYASFLVSNIEKIVSVNLEHKTLKTPEITVGYRYIKDDNETLDLLDTEKIISSEGNTYIIEITSKSKFEITQRIMSHASKCKVLYPQSFQTYIIYTLRKMKEGYIETI